MRGRLAGKIAVVTGAARGIGRAVARRYAAEKATVYGADVITDELEYEMNLLRQKGYDAHAVPTDVFSVKDTSDLAARVLDEQGHIDILANVAGIIILKTAEETTPEEWDRVLGINLRGPFLLCRALLPAMKAARRGAIINVSSRAGVMGFGKESAYCASKFGLEGFSRALAKELAPFGVSVNTVTPGALTHTSMSEMTYSAEQRKTWKDPDVITPAFVYLALQAPEGLNDQYVNAWELSEKLRVEGWA